MRAPAVAALLATALLATACSGGGSGGRHPASPVVVTDDPRLDAARQAFDSTRAAVISDVAAVTTAAAALDKQDTQAGKGAYDPVNAAAAKTASQAQAATSAVGKLPRDLAAYRRSLTGLATEAKDKELSAVQATALTGLAAAAGNEVAPLQALATGQKKGWPAYQQLASAQALWTTRAGAGYYPHTDDDLYDAQRAGQAYVVLVNPFRAALTAERTSLAAESTAFSTSRAGTSAALATATTAFS